MTLIKKQYITFLTCASLAVLALGGAVFSADHSDFPYWIVKAEYPRAGIVTPMLESNGVSSINWLFRVIDIIHENHQTWWKVEVSDRDGHCDGKADFFMDPTAGLIRDVKVSGVFQGRRIDFPVQMGEPGSFFLEALGVLPLDYAGFRLRELAKSQQLSQITQVSHMNSGEMIQYDYRVRQLDPGSIPSLSILTPGFDKSNVSAIKITGEGSSSRSWTIVFADGLPWWTMCETSTYRAWMTEYHGGDQQ